MTSPVKLHIVPNCGLKITPKLSEDDDGGRRTSLHGHTLDFKTADGVNGKRPLSYIIEDIDKQGFPIKLHESSFTNEQKKDFVGVMSPLSPLSLPKQRKKLAGINERATRYAYIHPPRGLAGTLDWGRIKVVWKQLKYHDKKMNESMNLEENDSSRSLESSSLIRSPRNLLTRISLNSPRSMKRKNCSENDSSRSRDSTRSRQPLIVPPSNTLVKQWALACFSLMGAFVYFEDKEDGVDVLSVNALCLSKLGTQGGLRMAGPFQTPLETIQVLKKLDRFEVIPMENYHECGFVAKAWICPKEQGSPHGSLVFLKDDNTALTYNIKSGADALRSGSMSILADLIDPHELDFKMIMGQNFVTSYVACNDDESCKRKFLEHFPSWSSLHYSCRFKPDDFESIVMLKEENHDSVSKLDRFNRSILHLACSSTKVTGEVVRELLNNEDNLITKKILYGKTKYSKKLPLHLAVHSGAPQEVIDELLNASKTRQTYLQKTADGRMPLHIAVEKMADKRVIESLLKADIERQSMYEEFKGMLPLHIACWNGHYDAVKLLLEYDTEGKSLHQNILIATYLKFKSKRDYLTFNNNEAVVSHKNDITKGDRQNDEADRQNDDIIPWVRALHIALLKCSNENSTKITKLLLQEEYWNLQSEEGEVTVTMTDSAGRNPLMLACMQNADEEIIKALINLDQTKNTAAQVDKLGNTALHHLCEHKYVNASVVELLLDAEDECYNRKRKKSTRPLLSLSMKQKFRSCLDCFRTDAYEVAPVKKSTSRLNNQRMTPLKLAIRAGGPTAVLEMLLESGRIDMTDFDDQTIHQLSLRVCDSHSLQESINHKLAARHSCFKLVTSLVIKAAIFLLFLSLSNKYLSDKGSFVMARVVLVAYVIFEIIKEINEFLSLGASYLLSRKNFADLARIGLVIFCLRLFYSRLLPTGNPEFGNDAYALIAASLLLGTDFILALRSTFLPFAKFAGGLMAICATLFPFLTVSTVLILCFIIAFRVDAWVNYIPSDQLNHPRSNFDIPNSTQYVDSLCEDSSPEELCRSSFGECTQMVLKAFFTGEFESDGVFYLTFGFVIILILLTIIIAIVSDAWDAVENKATEYYWESRITFLHESRSSVFMSKRPSSGRKYIIEIGTIVAQWVDDFGFVGLFQEEKKFSWSRDSPYNQVSDIDQYLRPYDYFHPSIAIEIKHARSFKADVYWISQKQKGLERRKSLAIATIRWTVYFVTYSFLVLLGLVTGGFFWPENLRRSILSYGYKSEDYGKDTDLSKQGTSQESKARQTNTMVDMIPKKTKMQTFDECFIEIMNSSAEIADGLDTKVKLQLIAKKLGVDMKHFCNGECN